MAEEVENYMEVIAQNELDVREATKFVEQNVLPLPTTPQETLACVDEGYGREYTAQAPIRLAGGDVGALGAIVAAAQQNQIELPEPTALVHEYINAKKTAFGSKKGVTLSYHTDGHAKAPVPADAHHVDDMHCGHLNGLQVSDAAEAYQFTDGGEYMRNLTHAVVGIHGKVEGVKIKKIRLREDQSHHDAKGALLVTGNGSVHSRSKNNDASYFVVDMSRTQDYFNQVIPHMKLGISPDAVFSAYGEQATTTLPRVSTNKGNMPIFQVTLTGKSPQVALAGRV